MVARGCINKALEMLLKYNSLTNKKRYKMKLKKGIVTNKIDGECFAIATGKATKSFNGIIKNNDTAAFIFELLKKEQTEDSLVNEIVKKYDVDEQTARNDIKELISLLKEKKIVED